MNKPRILFVGPVGFKEHSWRTRSEYILPDLFSSVSDVFDIDILTGPVPDFARKSLSWLCFRFNVQHHEYKNPGKYGDVNQRWIGMVREVASKISPFVITNSLGSLRLGVAIAKAAKETGARSVIRVAGDEIGARDAMGFYESNQSLLDLDKSVELEGFLGADSIIAMSPWEQSRIMKTIGSQTNKVEICIRGVDLLKFAPDSNIDHQRGSLRFLYVGRKSAEKGYDVIEQAAKIIFENRRDIKIIFVGNFDIEHIENRQYVGWVETADLPSLYRDVDAFVLTSRTEGFPQVLSEAMASGLPCILSEHLFSPILVHEVDALLVKLDPKDVALKIQLLADNIILKNHLSLRSRAIALRNLDHEDWQQRYIAILKGDSFSKCTMLDVRNSAKLESANKYEISSKSNRKPRVVLILPRRLGAIGTPGSYSLADSLHNHVELHCISNSAADNNDDVKVVCDVRTDLVLSKLNFNRRDYKGEIVKILESHRPSIVHVVNWHGWTELLPYLRSYYQDARYIIDFKTPLMAEGDKRSLVQINGSRASKCVDLVLSRNSEDVATWIDSNYAPIYVYPLGVALAELSPRMPEGGNVRKCNRFVYIGSTHEKRKLDSLFLHISRLPSELLGYFTLDCYGSGGDHDALNALIAKLGLTNHVYLLGTLPQHELFIRLKEYDCGLAWVPREIYDAAPSIKYLEYLGSGLVVLATNTLAHQRNLSSGLHSILFSETFSSFTDAVRSVMIDGYPVSCIQSNLNRIKRFSWDSVVENNIVQAYRRLIFGYFDYLSSFNYGNPVVVGDNSSFMNYFDTHSDAINIERLANFRRTRKLT